MNKANFINGSIYAIYLLIGLLSTYIASMTSLVMAGIVIVIEYIRIVGLLTKVYKVVAIIFVVNVGLIAYNGYKTELLLSKQTELTETKSELTEKFLNKNWLKASTFERLIGEMKSVEELPVDYRVLTLLYIALEIALLMLVYGINQKLNAPIVQEANEKTEKTTYQAYKELKAQGLKIENHSEFVRILRRNKIWQVDKNRTKLERNIENTGARASIAYVLTEEEARKIKEYFTENKENKKNLDKPQEI